MSNYLPADVLATSSLSVRPGENSALDGSSKQQSHRASTVEECKTIASTAADLPIEQVEEPIPDGGYGWICVLSSFVFHFFAVGIESTWGVYQRYFFNANIFPGSSNSTLAWVGSIQATGVPIIGIFAGMLAERIGYKPTSAIGSTIMALGLVLASFSTEVWHLYLTQGLIFGLGSGLAFIPAVSVLSQWFDKRRGLATGIGVSGSGIGGLVLSPLTQTLIAHLGFRWALRVTGLMSFGALTIAGLFLKTRRAPHSGTSTPVALRLMKDKIFLVLCSVGFFSGFGFYTPSFYVPDYATDYLGLSPADGATAVALISGLSAVGRVLLGVFGDHFGHLNALALCQGMGAVSQMTVWPFTKNLSGLMAFCSFFGLFSGGFVSLYPVVAADLYGTEHIASVAGALFSGYVPGTLVGPPIAGAIIDKYTAPDGSVNFIPAQLYGGSSMAAAAAMAFAVKLIHARRKGIEDGRTRTGYAEAVRQVFSKV